MHTRLVLSQFAPRQVAVYTFDPGLTTQINAYPPCFVPVCTTSSGGIYL
jgi:hypothetical protein